MESRSTILTAMLTSVFLASAYSYAGESYFEIRKLQTNPVLTAKELTQIANEESASNVEQGYDASNRVVELFADAVYRKDVDGTETEIPFRLRRPIELVPNRRYPLIVVFHGYGESDDDNARQLSHMQYGIKSLLGPNAIDAYVLATQCPKGSLSWESDKNRYGIAPIDYTLEIVEKLKEHEPIASDGIAALGVCSGANALERLAESRPKLFCAIALCGYAPSPNKEDAFPTTTWAFNNVEDDVAPIKNVRQTIAAARERGENVYLSERSGAHDSWSKALREDCVLTWLYANASTSVLPPPPGKKIVVARSFQRAAFEIIVPLLAIVLFFTLYSAYERRRFKRIQALAAPSDMLSHDAKRS